MKNVSGVSETSNKVWSWDIICAKISQLYVVLKTLSQYAAIIVGETVRNLKPRLHVNKNAFSPWFIKYSITKMYSFDHFPFSLPSKLGAV